MATALALLPEKKEVESWRSQQNWDHRLRYGLCNLRHTVGRTNDRRLSAGPGPNFAGSGSMLRIGRSSGDLRPSHRTITLALLAVTRSTTPHRSVQSSWPGRMLLLNAAAAREVSFTLSPRLIIFNARFSQPNKLAGRRCLRSHPPAPLVRERSERGLVIRAKLLFVAAKRTTPLQPNILAMRWLMYWATSQIPQH